MASVLSHRLRRLERKLRPVATQFIIVAPPSIQDEEGWLREYAPQHLEWREERRRKMGPTEEAIYPDRPGSYVWRRVEVPVGDPTHLSELQEIGGRVFISPDF